MPPFSTFARAVATLASVAALLPTGAVETLAHAEPLSPAEPRLPVAPTSHWYIQAEAGPAFATFLPIDAGGITEHQATGGSQSALGTGYGFEIGRMRLDTGLRVQHLHLQIQGSYSLVEVNDLYRANYDYLALLLDVGVTSHLSGLVNGFGSFGLGTARHFSDRRGGPLRNHQLPIYGLFETGLLIRVAAGMDVLLGLSWVPPFAKVSVFAPVVGLRVQL